jgi:hypothetical protein
MRTVVIGENEEEGTVDRRRRIVQMDFLNFVKLVDGHGVVAAAALG